MASSKNCTEVLIGGKVFTLSGFESEEYLQRVSTYLNHTFLYLFVLHLIPKQNLDVSL